MGEPVLSTISIYRRIKLLDTQEIANNSPDTIVVKLEGGVEDTQEIDGTPYRVTTFYRYLVPIKPGVLEIPPFVLYTIVPDQRYRQRRDPFGGLFGGPRGKEKRVRSGKNTLTVNPVPSENRPANFRELVGVYEGSVNLDKSEIKMGETVTATIEIAGNGRLETLREIKLELGDFAKIYPDKPEITTSPTPEIYSANGLYKIAIVPTKPGEFDLGQVVIPYFDPERKSFSEMNLELGKIRVEGSKEQVVSSNNLALPSQRKKNQNS